MTLFSHLPAYLLDHPVQHNPNRSVSRSPLHRQPAPSDVLVPVHKTEGLLVAGKRNSSGRFFLLHDDVGIGGLHAPALALTALGFGV
jgi:hypothetical protein